MESEERFQTMTAKKYDQCILMNRLGLHCIGIWPLSTDASKFRVVLRNCRVSVLYFACFTIMIFQWFDIYSLWGDIEANTETFLSNIFIFGVLVKVTNFLKSLETFKVVLDTMRSNWMRIMGKENSRENKEIMYGLSMKARDHSIKYAFIVSIATMLYFVMPFMNANDASARDRKYPFFGRYYFDRDSDVVYGLYYMSQVITGSFVGIANYATDTIFLFCMYHFCAQLRILQNDLLQLGNEGFTDNYKVVKLIQRHQIEIKNVRLLQSIFSGSSFQQLLVSCLMICVTGFKLIVSLGNRDPEFVTYLVSMPLFLFQILFYCQPGNELIVQSQSLSEAIYQSSWVNLDRVSVRHLIFMIQRSQKPLTITAGKIYVLSLQNFMKIVKTSMSALSVLQAMYRKVD